MLNDLRRRSPSRFPIRTLWRHLKWHLRLGEAVGDAVALHVDGAGGHQWPGVRADLEARSLLGCSDSLSSDLRDLLRGPDVPRHQKHRRRLGGKGTSLAILAKC